MNNGRYRTSVKAFLDETEWDGITKAGERRLKVVLRYFSSNVPAGVLDSPGDKSGPRLAHRPSHGRWTKLMGWMQAVNYEHAVNPYFLVRKNDLLVAFRDCPVTRMSHRYGNWYCYVDRNDRHRPSPRGLGIPLTQYSPIWYTVQRSFTCLCTCAGDAFLSWVDPDVYAASYSYGGNKQLFIWNAKQKLEPHFDE